MKDVIRSYCEEYGFPEEATESLLKDFEALQKTAYYPLFAGQVRKYEEDDASFYYSLALRSNQKIADATGINKYALDLLLFICLTPHCRHLYEDAELPTKIYHDSMLDLKWKAVECKNVYGVWGSFVASWFDRFFDLTRFTLGRLQYEEELAGEPYEKNGIKLKPGDPLVQIHIPSAGKLDIGQCVESLQIAADFYADLFPDGIAKFTCHSWLLSERNDEYLSPECNIVKFKHLFDVVRTDPASSVGSDLWRIFNRPYEGTLEGYPTDTSLRRAYLKMLNEGKTAGYGRGYIFFRDGKILNR